MDIRRLKGIGEKSAQLLHKLGIDTVEDLLLFYPKRYDVYTPPVTAKAAETEALAAVEGVISEYAVVKRVRQLMITASTFTDMDGTQIQVSWYNMPYLKQQLHKGDRYVFRGRLTKKGSRYQMEQPVMYRLDAYREKLQEMQPVYGLTKGLTNNLMVKAVKQALDMHVLEPEFLPASVRSRWELAEYNFAISNIHFPSGAEAWKEARRRLVFDEFFFFISALCSFKDQTGRQQNQHIITDFTVADRIQQHLSYSLTPAQQHVWKEIRADLSGNQIMNRLIQGDVGCGKTIVAILALCSVAEAGYQGAFMVPTEVLARQHFQSIMELLEQEALPYRVILLTGSMTAKEKREAYAQIASGEADIIIGTHALIQEKVDYKALALVITDEQHRFGVRQRENLMKKGREPHVLVMSATPIPRTLAIILYGDLDISIIDTLPANRIPIKNCVVTTEYRPKAYSFIEQEVRKGRQAYVICPMVEASESMDGEDVISYTARLRAVLPSDISVGTLHGQLRPAEKNQIMEDFSKGRIQVLVSTTVVEVGVNVPNATVMMVENAERFGLAGLHQLRGRVGRGKEQSYCIFVSTTNKQETIKRLEILKESNDGFHIANEDLKLRGPGDLFGVRQSGDLAFELADIYQDADIMKAAAQAAQAYTKGQLSCTELEQHRIAEKLQGKIEKYSAQMNL